MEIAKIEQILLDAGYLTEEEISKAREEARKEKVGLLVYLKEKEIISKDIIGQALAESLGLSFVDLDNRSIDDEKRRLIPQEAAEKFRAVIAGRRADVYIVATDNPSNKNLKISLVEILGQGKFELAYALAEDIDEALMEYKKPLRKDFSEKIQEKEQGADNIVDEMIIKAVTHRASDVHVEPREDEGCIIRFRIDGVLQEAGKLSKSQYDSVVNRFKVMAGLRTDEHMLPQDGAIRFKKNEKRVDLRISVAPAISGEKIVVRILSEYVKDLSFAELGMSERIQDMVKRSIKKPFGMILIAGPTGSGKTTSLYSMLVKISQPGINIVTIEDPVEYRIEGVNHIQVNPKIELTFAKGLKTIVRQDPDIILVGEIRDVETARISVNAALTGHLLLSTFHANNSSVAITRLLDMDIEPFAFASTAELIISQRLARKICTNCRYSEEMSIKDLEKDFPKIEKYFTEKKASFYKGKGCEKCQNQGYVGRTGIFEAIEITPEIKKILMEKPSADEIWKVARSQGASSFFEDGVEKVKKGITTLEELYRISSPNE